MNYISRDFGEIEISDSEVIDFLQPPFGFDEYKKYALLQDKELGSHIAWLQALDDPNICFILFDPSYLPIAYTPEIPDTTFSLLGDGNIECWVIAVIQNNLQSATVNLKSPIIINTETMKASQIILEQDYSIKHPLMKGAE